MHRTKNSTLIFAISVQVLVYALFFVVLSQSWSLIDDYNYVLDVKNSGIALWNHFLSLNSALMHVGRFKPIASFLTSFRLWALPLTPAAFHGFNLCIVLGMLFFFFKTLRSLGIGLQQSLIGVLIALFSFAVKDMVLFSTTSESLFLFFFFLSFWCFLKEQFWFAFFTYVLALCSKEIGAAFFTLFFIYSFFKYSKKQLPFLVGTLLFSFAFIVFVKLLPQVYTAHYSFSRIDFLTFLKAFTIPLLKNYGLVIGLLAILLVLSKGKNKINKQALATGLSLSIIYTLALIPWGPFDSWWYLHAPIPMGWALVFASVWPEMHSKVPVYILGLFATTVSINGSLNYRDFLYEAKKVAEIACEENQRNPGIKIISNCNEGSSQLRNYLLLDKTCEPAPFIAYNPHFSESAEPYVFLYSKKCDAFEWSLQSKHKLDFKFWTIYKNL